MGPHNPTGARAPTNAEENRLRGHGLLDRRDRGLVLLTRTDAVDLLHGHDEDLAVPDVARARGSDDRVHGRLHEMIGHADLEPHLLGQLHLHGRPTVVLDSFQLTAVPLHTADGETADFGAEQRLQDVGELVGTNDGHHQLHARPPSGSRRATATAADGEASGSTRMAPSSCAYASSPCWVMSRPMPSSRLLTRRGAKSPTSLSSTKVPTPLNRMAAPTAAAWMRSCFGLPNSSPSVVPFHVLVASTPVSNAPTVPPRPCAAT